MKPSIQFIKREDGVKIAYSKFGSGEPLVCAAPWVTSLSYIIEDPFAKKFWDWLAQEVTVIVYDKHGCGQSDRDRVVFTLESELLDLETVTKHLGLDAFDLLGSSMAGPVAIAYASRNPEKVKHLILYGSYAYGKNIAKEDLKIGIISLIKASWGLGSKAISDIFLPGATTEELQSLARFQRESSSPEIAAKLIELCWSLDVTDLLSSIKMPTLILHRKGDKIITFEHGRHLATEIPNARFRALEGKIHPYWYGDSTEIIKEILSFVGKDNSAVMDDVINRLSTKETEITEQATIVFTDIVSSTKFVTQVGDAAARDLFLKQDEIIRAQIMKHGGKELQNLGDGFMLSFESASAAIKCSCDIQKEISKNIPSIKVRMGINTGEVVRREGRRPFGQAVVIASRIASKAKGEQILISDVTMQLAAGGRFPFLEKGRFKPKGFSRSIKLYEVFWKG